MRVSYLWLREYIKAEVDPGELVEILTNTGLEVSSVERTESVKGGLEGLVIGEVKSVEKHPNADKLVLATVDVGNSETRKIVCGAPNIAEGQKVVVALPGTTIHPLNGKPVLIKSGKIRGEVSDGMICAEDEIGLGPSHDGVLVLKKNAVPGHTFREYMNVKEDYSIEVDLTPNRTDAISHFGVARDYMAVKNLQPGQVAKRLSLPDVSSFSVDNHDLEIRVSVRDREACPRYSGVSMTGVKVSPSPAWLSQRLQSIGLKPVNNIVDAATFVMYETGQPLHVFDASKIDGNHIIVKKVQGGSPFITLDGQERKLGENDLMICNATSPMCIAGIFGGLHSGVGDETVNIFIESACFAPAGIRRTARAHSLSTDASYRYERGSNAEATIYALKRLALIIRELTGAKVSSEIIDEYPVKLELSEISLSWKFLFRVSGCEIAKSDVRNILTSLDIDIMTEDVESLKLRIPGYRIDVKSDIDVVEEILRIYGYNRIPMPERMLTSFSARPAADADAVRRELSSFLSSRGFREVINNSLTAQRPGEENGAQVKVLNALSSELSFMRSSMLWHGLENINYNRNRQVEDIRIFEFGKIYSIQAPGKFHEGNRLAIWFTGHDKPESWRASRRKADFHDAAEILQLIFNKLGFRGSDFSTRDYTSELIEFGIVFNHGDGKAGEVGKVRRGIPGIEDGGGDVFYAEVNWTGLLTALAGRKIAFRPLPRFPSVRRDLALLIDEGVRYADLEKAARQCEKKFLTEINLFDIYKGKGIEPGRKSYALSFIFRDDEKTLTDKQVDAVMEKLMGKFREEFSAEIR